MDNCGKYITGEDYIDLLYRRSDELNPGVEGFRDYCITQIDDRWGIIHLNRNETGEVDYENFGYTSFPIVCGVQDYGAMAAAGITQVREQPFLTLRGTGTLIGIVDTGIRYDHEVFIREDGSSIIDAIWDQTAESEPVNRRITQDVMDDNGILGISGNTISGDGKRNSVNINAEPELDNLAAYGRVYNNAAINEALSSSDPQAVVPVTDEAGGHGTMLAGLAAGQEKPDRGFTGAAPGARLVIVKLKQAKRYLREFYLVNDNALCYSEIDIILGIRFLEQYAQRAGMPISIIIGLGSNISSHMGSTVLSDYLDNIGRNIGRCLTTCTGNYANSRLHFRGNLLPDAECIPIEINVGENEKGFYCVLWSQPPEVFSLEFISPIGRIEQRVPPKINEQTTLRFILEGTQIEIFYGLNQAVSGLNFVAMRFITPSPGIWTIRAYGYSVLSGGFNMWINNKEFLWSDTYFLQPDPYNTITDPGNTNVPITAGAYNYRDGSIYIGSGRGTAIYSDSKPDIVAPGVNVLCPLPGRADEYGQMTGSSLAAAITGGSAALILEYGIVKGFYPYMRSYTVKNFLVNGADRREDYRYPDALFGYGTLNVYKAIESIRK